MSTMNRSVGAALLALLALCGSAQAQAPQPTSTSAASARASVPRMERLSGVWVEGPGFNITYGGDYEACAQKCLGTPQCVMIEYYRPEKKCNMYDKLRPRVKGGSSDVALRK
jgi:hypothetical protein